MPAVACSLRIVRRGTLTAVHDLRVAIREICESPRRKLAHELGIRSHGAARDRSAECETEHTCLIPEPHRRLKILGRYCGFGASFQLPRILTWCPVGTLVIAGELSSGSASKGDVAHKPSKAHANHEQSDGPPRTESEGEAVSELQENVVVKPTKETTKNESESVPNPREQPAQGMREMARR